MLPVVSFKLLNLIAAYLLTNLNVERRKCSFPDAGAVSAINVNPVTLTVLLEDYVGYFWHLILFLV